MSYKLLRSTCILDVESLSISPVDGSLELPWVIAVEVKEGIEALALDLSAEVQSAFNHV